MCADHFESMSTPRYLYLSTTWICQSQHNTVMSCHRKIRLLFFSSPFRQAQCEPRHLKKSATIPTQDVDVSSHLAVINTLPRLADAAIQADALSMNQLEALSQLLHHKTVSCCEQPDGKCYLHIIQIGILPVT